MTQAEQRSVTLTVTAGLFLLLVAHAFMSAVAMRAIPPIDPCACGHCSGVEAAPRGGIDFDKLNSAGDLPKTTLPVNVRARDEMKQQAPVMRQPVPCVNCQPTVVNSQQVPAKNATPVATTPKYSISVFVGTDAKSQQLLSWFNSDPSLQGLKAKVNFHAYTKDNALYKTRYSNVVPVEYFPAVIFSDPSGGHIHAAYRDMLPASAADLYADMQRAAELQRQVVQAAKQQAPSDAMAQTPDCDGPNCRTPILDRDRQPGPLFDRPEEAKSLFDFVVNYSRTQPSTLLLILAAVAIFVFLRR